MRYRVLLGNEEEYVLVANAQEFASIERVIHKRIRDLFKAAGDGGICGGFRITVHPDSAECDHEIHGCAPT